jgi:hypothetical protein
LENCPRPPGEIAHDRLFPPDTISNQGLEGTFDPAQIAVRSVIDGTGEYLGALGQVSQKMTGTNTTVFSDGSGDAAFNFRFDFDFRRAA